MIKKWFLSIFLILLFPLCLLAKEEDTENLRNFDAKSDIKFGPILGAGYGLFSSDKFNYNPRISLIFQGESFKLGTSQIAIDYIGLTKTFSTDSINTVKFTEASPNNATSVSKNLVIVSFLSPIFYDNTINEFGGIGGFNFQNISHSGSTISSDSGTNDLTKSLGFNFGLYYKNYFLYPFVPSILGKVIGGNMYDNGQTIQQSKLTSAFKLGLLADAKLDFYINKRLFFGISYNFTNFDMLYLFPTKRKNIVEEGNESTEPLDDNYFNFQENTQFISGYLGFLF